jgi:hypothetical protein
MMPIDDHDPVDLSDAWPENVPEPPLTADDIDAMIEEVAVDDEDDGPPAVLADAIARMFAGGGSTELTPEEADALLGISGRLPYAPQEPWDDDDDEDED